jgi:hypothetical protein
MTHTAKGHIFHKPNCGNINASRCPAYHAYGLGLGMDMAGGVGNLGVVVGVVGPGSTRGLRWGSSTARMQSGRGLGLEPKV